jgi:hypothetical protein
LPTVRQPGGQLVPRAGVYRVRILLDPPPGVTIDAVALGTAVIEAAPRSLLVGWSSAVTAVLVRESGF